MCDFNYRGDNVAKTQLENVALGVQILNTKLVLSVWKKEMVWNTLLYCSWRIQD